MVNNRELSVGRENILVISKNRDNREVELRCLWRGGMQSVEAERKEVHDTFEEVVSKMPEWEICFRWK